MNIKYINNEKKMNKKILYKPFLSIYIWFYQKLKAKEKEPIIGVNLVELIPNKGTGGKLILS